MSDLERSIADCIRCLRALASGQGTFTLAEGAVNTLELLANVSPRSRETMTALALVDAFRAYELRMGTNPVMARHELELAVLRARDRA